LKFGGKMVYEPLLVPVWFYSYSSVVYAVTALVSFLISYFSFRLYKMSLLNMNLMMMLTFVFMGVAFSVLAATSYYTYMSSNSFKLYENLYGVVKYGFMGYYTLSLVAYILLTVMYLPRKFREKLFVAYMPLWYLDFTAFHIISAVLVGYIVIMNLVNFMKKRKIDSLLVLLAFVMIELSHVMMMLTQFDAVLYLVAHAFLAVGFASLLAMLIRVNYPRLKLVGFP